MRPRKKARTKCSRDVVLPSDLQHCDRIIMHSGFLVQGI